MSEKIGGCGCGFQKIILKLLVGVLLSSLAREIQEKT
jgi:hypothetical protein